jgi:uncharacterized membrane protein
MLFAARLMNVLFFLTALVIALLLAPSFRALFIAVALMPMTLHQAAAVSADPVTISFSFVGFALVLRAREQSVSRRYLAALFAMVPVWVLCKNSFWALPVLPLIPAAQFNGNLKRLTYLLTITVVTIAALFWWRNLTRDAFEDFRAAELSQGIDVYANARTIASHPLAVLHDVTTKPGSGSLDHLISRIAGVSAGAVLAPPLRFANYIRKRLSQFVGAFGWNFLAPPFRLVYLAVLLLVACVEPNPMPFTRGDRVVLVFVFAVALIETYSTILILDGTHENGHFSFWSSGFQGRYMIPYCLAGLLALKQKVTVLTPRVIVATVLAASTLFGLLSVGTVVRFYYQ